MPLLSLAIPPISRYTTAREANFPHAAAPGRLSAPGMLPTPGDLPGVPPRFSTPRNADRPPAGTPAAGTGNVACSTARGALAG